jgi:hypothetical protein
LIFFLNSNYPSLESSTVCNSTAVAFASANVQTQQQQQQAAPVNQNTANYTTYYQSNNLRQQYASYEANSGGNGKPGQRTSMGTSNSSINTNSGFDASYHRPWTPTTFNSQDYQNELQKQHQQRMQNIENGRAFNCFGHPSEPFYDILKTRRSGSDLLSIN